MCVVAMDSRRIATQQHRTVQHMAAVDPPPPPPREPPFHTTYPPTQCGRNSGATGQIIGAFEIVAVECLTYDITSRHHTAPPLNDTASNGCYAGKPLTVTFTSVFKHMTSLREYPISLAEDQHTPTCTRQTQVHTMFNSLLFSSGREPVGDCRISSRSPSFSFSSLSLCA